MKRINTITSFKFTAILILLIAIFTIFCSEKSTDPDGNGDNNGNDDSTTVVAKNGIVFGAKDGGIDVNLYYYDMENMELLQLTNTGSVGFPKWSYQKDRIAFELWESAQADICIMNPDSGGILNLTSTPEYKERSPSWFPDDKSIAYFLRDDTVGRTFIIRHYIESGNKDTLWDCSQSLYYLSVSPNGIHFCYTTSSVGSQIYLINSEIHDDEFIDLYSLIKWFDWSTEGGQLAASSTDSLLFLTPLHSLSSIIDQHYIFDYCIFSPNDTMIAYARESLTSSNEDIMLRNLASGSANQLTDNSGTSIQYRGLAFSHDNKQIAFAESSGGGNYSIGIIEISSGSKTVLENGFSYILNHGLDW
ncbi:PD40 domain-containing protein [bacterium]|nr:PD40 domain-containing protein [bacterium]